MHGSRLVYLLAAVMMVLGLASCSRRPQPVSITVRSHNNAIDLEDSQRIHINGKRVGLRDAGAELQSMGLSHTVPVHVQVGWKCDPSLLGKLVQRLLSVKPRPTLLIEAAPD